LVTRADAQLRAGLKPHHIGEELVKRLVGRTQLADIIVHDAQAPEATRTLAAVLGRPDVPSIEVNARLVLPGSTLKLDGKHEVDCAFVYPNEVVALELKLGETGMSPGAFAGKFVEKGLGLSHAAARISGSVVSILDSNGRAGPGGGMTLSLSCSGRPVRPSWLLMVLESTWQKWARADDLANALGTAQLGGVLVLEELARSVGVRTARTVALEIADESVAAWFLGSDEAARTPTAGAA
jgi:hypothetical protein